MTRPDIKEMAQDLAREDYEDDDEEVDEYGVNEPISGRVPPNLSATGRKGGLVKPWEQPSMVTHNKQNTYSWFLFQKIIEKILIKRRTSKTRFYKLPAAAKVFLDLK